MNVTEHVILVDSSDNPIGIMEKMEAHEKALLHRAFSVFIFNNHGQMLIHKRALEKYHSPGLWTNACCSHPRVGETLSEAAHRRLMEEMGFDCPLEKKFDFIYKARLDGGLTEHEFDHVLVGSFNGDPCPNPAEVMDWKYINWEELNQDVLHNPQAYTTWFKIALEKLNQSENIEKK